MQINTLKYFKTISFFTYFPRPELRFVLLWKEFPSFLFQAVGLGLYQGLVISNRRPNREHGDPEIEGSGGNIFSCSTYRLWDLASAGREQQVQVRPSQAQFLHEHSKLISFRAVNLTCAFLKIEYGGGAGRQNQKPTCKGV